jgi:hypothetical protein
MQSSDYYGNIKRRLLPNAYVANVIIIKQKYKQTVRKINKNRVTKLIATLFNLKSQISYLYNRSFMALMSSEIT